MAQLTIHYSPFTIKMKRYNINILLLALLAATSARAQMPNDGFAMDKGVFCTVLNYSQSTWDHYWEGTRYRNNLNIGMFRSQMLHPMLGYGISDRLNVFAGLPYINNSSNAGTMAGKKGWQDFSFDAKYRLAKWKKNQLALSVFASAGVSLPVTDYIPDFLPYSIGLGSKTVTGRLILHTVIKEHVFVTLQGGYTARSNIQVDRQTYYGDRQYYSNEMRVPNMWGGAAMAGYDCKRFRAQVYYGAGLSETGSDMRPNDMPLPIHQMNRQSLGFYGILWVPHIKGLGIQASVDQTVAGRNMGKAFTWMGGVQYFFTPFKKK
jgi:hypothetical protein